MEATLTHDDTEDLRQAIELLGHQGFAARIVNILGSPIEKGFDLLPERWSEAVKKSSVSAMQSALKMALLSMDRNFRGGNPSNILHKILSCLSGATGGMFGLPALAVELPISTTIALRSIADIARSEGEDVKSVDTQLACIEVFAFGGGKSSDNRTETGYYAVRMALTNTLSEAAEYIAQRGMAEEGAPALIRFITQVATYFGVTVSEKIAAQAVPIIGGIGGATINLLFIDHFQDMARGHFIIRRLERKYSPEVVKSEYHRLKSGFSVAS